MASKAVPGRGITLPFVEGLHGTPFYFKLNPYVTLYSCVLIWGFIVYTISMRWDAYKEFQTWFQWVTDEWTWLYIASQNLWIGVLLYILCSKYAKIKLGGPDDEPEFSRCSTAGTTTLNRPANVAGSDPSPHMWMASATSSVSASCYWRACCSTASRKFTAAAICAPGRQSG